MYYIFLEQPKNWQLGFQKPATPIMEGIINFHHDLFFFLIVICLFVMYILWRCLVQFNSKTNKKLLVVTHAATLEIVWTLIPAVILIFIAIPSFSLLYSMDEIIPPLLTIKIIGHQWYWTYEFLDPSFILQSFFSITKKDNSAFENVNDLMFSYDSYMLADDQIQYKNQRLLAVDHKLYLPVKTHVRLLITSADVLHSWAVPALGVKLDSCPGRLNQTSTFIKRTGNFFGQCSEICGINHGFMPIHVAAIDLISKIPFWFNQNNETLATLFGYIVKNKLKS